MLRVLELSANSSGGGACLLRISAASTMCLREDCHPLVLSSESKPEMSTGLTSAVSLAFYLGTHMDFPLCVSES